MRMCSAGRTTRIIDPDGDEWSHYESSNNMPDLTDRLHEAKSSPEENRELMLRIRRSNIRLGDSRIKVLFPCIFENKYVLTRFLELVREVCVSHFSADIHLHRTRCQAHL